MIFFLKLCKLIREKCIILSKDPIHLENAPLSFELEKVKFSYKADDRIILNELSFKLPAGETWALVGESGCGKSTISRLFTGLLEPDEGTQISKISL